MKTDYISFLKWASNAVIFSLWLCYGLAIALLLSSLFGGFAIVMGLLPAIASFYFGLLSLSFSS